MALLFDDSQERDRTPLNGIFTVMVDASEAEENSDERGAYFTVDFVVIDEGEHHGRRIPNRRFYVTGELVHIFKSFVSALGMPMPQRGQPIVPRDYHAKRLRVRCRPDRKEGRYTNIDRFLPLESEVKPSLFG